MSYGSWQDTLFSEVILYQSLCYRNLTTKQNIRCKFSYFLFRDLCFRLLVFHFQTVYTVGRLILERYVTLLSYSPSFKNILYNDIFPMIITTYFLKFLVILFLWVLFLSFSYTCTLNHLYLQVIYTFSTSWYDRWFFNV